MALGRLPRAAVYDCMHRNGQGPAQPCRVQAPPPWAAHGRRGCASWDILPPADHGAARPMYISLRYLRQCPAEQLRDYIRHFRQLHERTRGIPEAAVIAAFFQNVRSVGVRDAMTVHWVHTIDDLYHVGYNCTRSLEAGVVPGVDSFYRFGPFFPGSLWALAPSGLPGSSPQQTLPSSAGRLRCPFPPRATTAWSRAARQEFPSS